MDIISLIVLSSATFLILRLGILPFVARKSGEIDPNISIGRKALEAGVTTAASIASLLSISALIALGIVKYFQNIKSTTLGQAESSLEIVRQANNFLGSIVGHFGFVILGFCAFATIIWSYRRTKIIGQNELNSQLSAKMEELQAKYLVDELEDLPPNEAMDEIEAHMNSRIKELSELVENEGDPETITQMRDNLQQLAELRHSIDLLRRAEAEVLKERQKPEEQIVKRKWVTFFTSNGFFDTLGFGGKVFAILGILCIVPASLVITGPITFDAIDGRKISLEEDVRNFSFVAETGKINQAYEELISEEDEEEKLTEEDEVIADELAQVFETELLDDELIAVTGQVTSLTIGHSINRENVRKNILSRTAARSNSISVSNAPQTSPKKSVIVTEELIAKSKNGKPLTPVGKNASKKYRELAKKNPSLWGKMKGGLKTYKASFARSASPVRVSSIAINQAIGDALSSVGGGKSIFYKQASKIGGDISADVAKAYFDASYKKFIVEFNATGDLAKSAKSSGKLSRTAFSPRQVSGLRQMASALPNQESMINHIQGRRANLNTSNPRINQIRVQSAIKRAGARSVNGLEALSGFDDYFPGHAGQEFKTNKASTARSLGFKGAPPKFSTATQAQLARSSRIASRSRSYIRLRGFSRVGGVLIGQKPEGERLLHINQFNWIINDKKLWFEIAVNDNEAKRLGPYSPAIANLALSYVADGRPTTVTMVNADPFDDLKILTHPALIDTGLGCRARRLDQFADGAASEGSKLEELRALETAKAMGEVQLYNLARNILFVEITKTSVGKDIIENNELLELANQAYQESELSNNLYSRAEFRLADKTTPLMITSKPAYFLNSTVELVEACRKTSTLPKFKTCLQNNAKLSASRIATHSLDWVAPKVDYVPWSGVRERKYTVDESFKFMESTYPKDLGPFRFMVQLAISSPAYFANPEKKWYDENNLEIEEYTDPEPWEFKKTEKLLNATILEGIKSDSEKRDVYLDMIEFTILQRFFRAAFDGAMSQTFPIDELERLHKETFEFVNDNAPTLRWHAQKLGLEFYLQKKLLEINNPGPKIKQCHAYIKILSEAKNHAQASSYNSWDDTCSGSALSGEVSDEVARQADQVADLLNLRKELNVGIDDFLAEDYKRNGCPKP